MAGVVIISGGRSLKIEVRCSNRYFHFNIPLNCTQAARWSTAVKGGCA